MREIDTDYLVIGGGASGMSFADSLTSHADVDVVIVDRQHRPGGHWLNAYPFVRLHTPSAFYGVNSRPLGHNRIDTTGPNAGFYERATAAEICDYFIRALDEQLLPTNKVRFLGMTDYRGADAEGHHIVSLVTGERTTIKVRKRLVDATFVESSVPSKHELPFEVDEGVRVIPPNDLVDLAEPAGGFTVIGCGKTAMDTCVWLGTEGVAPDRIRWIRPRDSWLMERGAMQPLDLVGAYMHLEALWVQAAAEAESGEDFALRMEAGGVFVRIDEGVEPLAYRGAIVSLVELDALKSISDVVRGRYVRRIGTNEVTFDDSSIVPTSEGETYIDCTAAGVSPRSPKPAFAGDTITLPYITLGNVPWGAATMGVVEALRDDDEEKNSLCPPLAFTGRTADMLELAYQGMQGLANRGLDPEIGAWTNECRLNPGAGASTVDDPRVGGALATIGKYIGAAFENLEHRVRARASVSA
ncbi:MAG: NAD(P)-binding protein [Actinomycetota bacterium]